MRLYLRQVRDNSRAVFNQAWFVIGLLQYFDLVSARVSFYKRMGIIIILIPEYIVLHKSLVLSSYCFDTRRESPKRASCWKIKYFSLSVHFFECGQLFHSKKFLSKFFMARICCKNPRVHKSEKCWMRHFE